MDFFNWLSEKAQTLIQSLIDVLPGSPINWILSNDAINEYVGYLNWFIPVYTFIGILENWLMAVVVYYVAQWGLRWIKAVE